MLKEIDILNINKYKDSISLFKDGAIALATSKNNKTNGLTIGWGSIGVLWRKPCCTVYIHKLRYSKEIFDNSDYFAVCFFEGYKDELEYFGTHSGRNEDKIENSHLSINKNDLAPYFEESKLVIICKKMGQSDFDNNHIYEDKINNWYHQDGVHTLYFGEIVKVLENG